MSSDFDPRATHDEDDVSALPVEVQELYATLTREVAAWHANAAPQIARINRRLQEQVTRLSAQAESETATNAAHRGKRPTMVYASRDDHPWRPGVASQGSIAPRRFNTLRRWVTTGAALAVVVTFLTVLSLAAHHPNSAPNSTQRSGAGAAGGSQSAPLSGGWIHLSRLDYAASFSANDPPAIAPSDPQVIYETMAQGLQQHQPASMRATYDGGRTWHTLTLPLPADHIGYAGVGVSPVNARTVFLSLIDTVSADCPANRLEPLTEGVAGAQFCRLEYTSVDGGAHWRMSDLPLAGGSHPGLLTASVNSGMAGPIQSGTVRAQGQRLFAGFICTDFSCTRLVTSVDGGLTWAFADQPLLSSGAANVCDYTASATGATLYAVTSSTGCDFLRQAPLSLWTSSDAGMTWTKVAQLATPNERGMVLTQNSATGASLLYMGLPRTTSLATDKVGDQFPVFSQSPSDVLVSVNGGQTWQQAPAAGIPSDHAVFLQVGLLGALRDGSVVVDVIPPATADARDASNFSGSDLYAWRPGEASWHKLSSVPSEIDSLLIVPSPSSDTENTFYTTLVNRSGAIDPFTIIELTGVN